MTPGARVDAAIGILDSIVAGAPAEVALTNWGRRSRYAGSGDRAAVRDVVFDVMRRWRSSAWAGGRETGRALVLGLLRNTGVDPTSIFTGEGFAPPQITDADAVGSPICKAPLQVRIDCPDWLWPLVQESLGEDAEAVMQHLQTRAPVFLRANLRKTDREKAIADLASAGIEARPHPLSATAIEVISNARKVQNSDVFRAGEVEMQDAASQRVAEDFAREVGRGTVLDYCAGGGGKALALAATGELQVTAHDADTRRMKDLPVRAARAGVDIATTGSPDGLYDGVFCDVPCSGSGAWRRQPEAKWKLTQDDLDRLTRTQDAILDAATALVLPGGCLGYATCSLFAVENDQRVDAFLTRHRSWREVSRTRLTPIDGGDGFFLAIFRRE